MISLSKFFASGGEITERIENKFPTAGYMNIFDETVPL
jgi:hypothetical protein